MINADPRAVEGPLLGPADAMGDVEQVGGEVGRRVDPVVDFVDRHHQHVTARQRIDRHERDTSLIAVHERPGNLTGDDPAEDRCHDTNPPLAANTSPVQ